MRAFMNMMRSYAPALDMCRNTCAHIRGHMGRVRAYGGACYNAYAPLRSCACMRQHARTCARVGLSVLRAFGCKPLRDRVRRHATASLRPHARAGAGA